MCAKHLNIACWRNGCSEYREPDFEQTVGCLGCNVQPQSLTMKDGVTCAGFLVPTPITPGLLSWATEHWGQDSMRNAPLQSSLMVENWPFVIGKDLYRKREDGEQTRENDLGRPMGWGSSFLSFKQPVTWYHVVQAGLELLVLLVQPPKCWFSSMCHHIQLLMIKPVQIRNVKF